MTIDLTPTEPVMYDGEWKRETLRGLMKQMGHDHRDNPAVARGIEVLCETRISTTPDKRSYIVLDRNGEPMRGSYTLKRLAQELAAQIEEAEGPTVEEIVAQKAASGEYRL